MNDPGEKPTDGALLVAAYEKGVFQAYRPQLFQAIAGRGSRRLAIVGEFNGGSILSHGKAARRRIARRDARFCQKLASGVLGLIHLFGGVNRLV